MKHYLGIDIGGTAVKLGIVDEAGAVLAKAEESVSFDGYRTPILTTVLKAAQAFLADRNIPAESLAGIGVSATGQIDSRKGIVAGTCGNLPNYIGAPIKAELEKTFGLPVTVANDANCMTLGEVWVGGAKGYTDVIGVTLGTGFGACFIVDGCYATYGPGVPIGGELWDYPFRGRIAEDFVSTRWFEEKFRQITGVAITGVKPMIDYYHADKYTAEVRAIFDEFARTFAEIMLPFVQRFGADTLVVGGGRVRAEEFFFPQLRAAFEQKGVQIPVVAMADTTTAIIAGAAALCK